MKAGSVVRLKSGGQKMSVGHFSTVADKVGAGDVVYAHCVWFAEFPSGGYSNEACEGRFAAASLVEVGE